MGLLLQASYKAQVSKGQQLNQVHIFNDNTSEFNKEDIQNFLYERLT